MEATASASSNKMFLRSGAVVLLLNQLIDVAAVSVEWGPF